MGNIITLIRILFWLIAVPLGIGILPGSLLPKSKRSVFITYICGFLTTIAVFEIIAIPCMLLIMYDAFEYCRLINASVQMILFALGVSYAILVVHKETKKNILAFEIKGFNYRAIKHRLEAVFPGESHPAAEDYLSPLDCVFDKKQRYSKESKILWGVFFAILLLQVGMGVFFASFDGDDAYYVVESVLAYQADVMNTILPYTGSSTALEIRHAFAVITMWIAYISSMCKVHATIVSHTILPAFLIPFTYMIYMEIGRLLFRRKNDMLPMFMIIMAVFMMFGNTSINTSETFFLTRTWQGKAMLGNITIPIIIWIFLWIAQDYRYERITGSIAPWMILTLNNMVSGTFSSMGVMFGSILIMILAMLIALSYRKFSIIFKSIVTIVPNVIYIGMYLAMK